MNDIEALQEIRRDAEQDVHDFEGAPFTGRTMADYIGKTRALICALSAIVERNMTERLIVGPDEVLVVRLNDAADIRSIAAMEEVLTARGLADRYIIVAGDIQLHKVQRAAPIAAQYSTGHVHQIVPVDADGFVE